MVKIQLKFKTANDLFTNIALIPIVGGWGIFRVATSIHLSIKYKVWSFVAEYSD